MKYILLSLSLLLVMASCQKSSDPSPSKEDYLRNGRWEISKLTVTYKMTYPVTADSTTLATPTACHADDFLTFGPGYNGGINSGSNKCSPSDPDVIPFTWETLNNGANLNIYGAGAMFGTNTVNATLKNFTSRSFTLSFYTTVANYFNANKTDTITYNYSFTNF
ncbi:MAG: hypothetical protein ACTHJ0_03540 [Flavipsychrobacter sp.]